MASNKESSIPDPVLPWTGSIAVLACYAGPDASILSDRVPQVLCDPPLSARRDLSGPIAADGNVTGGWSPLLVGLGVLGRGGW
jgi:hypothetical protein